MAKNRELFYGLLGNGTTVWRQEENDPLAHISDNGKLSKYKALKPEEQEELDNVIKKMSCANRTNEVTK